MILGAKLNNLKVLTYNSLFGGADGSDTSRSATQIQLISKLQPDIFLMQEARSWDGDGYSLLFAMEKQIGMRGFLSPALVTGQHVVTFIREPLKPIRFTSDAAHFHHAMGALVVHVPGIERPLTVYNVHLCPNGATLRQREAAYLAVQAAPDSLALIAGDFNSASQYDDTPEDWNKLPDHHRSRYLGVDLKEIDRSVTSHLDAAGWIDIGNALDLHKTPTVPTRCYPRSEFPTMRCDYVFATRALALMARSYEVIRNSSTDVASDHYPVLTSFDLS